MEESLKKLAISYKDLLLINDTTKNRQAILGIKHHLEEINSGDYFAKTIIDLDIQLILLNTLIKSEYALSPDILTCIEHLCSYKVYFARDCAVLTAESVLKNIFNLPAIRSYDYILVKSLKIITKIIENLDDYNSNKKLSFHLYLDTVSKYIKNKNDPIIIRAVMEMFSALLLHEKFQNHLNDDILTQVEIITDTTFKKLSEIFETDKKNCVTAVSKFCDSILSMLTKIQIFQQKKIDLLLENVKVMSVLLLKNKCIPYIAQYGLKYDTICLEYLCFVRTILKTNFTKEIIFDICQQLVNDLNFSIITKYLEKCEYIIDAEERNKTRQMCLMILCEIIVNVSETNLLPCIEDKCKKYLFKNLSPLLNTHINDWLNCLINLNFCVESKLSVIKFCTMYYVYSNNLKELLPNHFETFLEFLKCLPEYITINIYYLKDIWLLFAVLCCLYINKTNMQNALYKATINLQRLLSVHKNSYEKVVSFHPSIANWIFLNPYVSNELIYVVLHIYLVSLDKTPSILPWLTQCIYQYPRAGPLLLRGVEEGRALAPHPARMLRLALDLTPLVKDQSFAAMLCVSAARQLATWTKSNIDIDKHKWQVISSIYLLDLVSYVDVPYDEDLLHYCSKILSNSLSSLGHLDTLPEVFYSRALEYIRKILQIANSRHSTRVFSTFMNAKPMLKLLLSVLSSDDEELSFKSSQVWKILLEYQAENRIYCEHSLPINKDLLIKLTCTPNNEHLEINLQILLILLTKISKSILNLKIDEEYIRKFYFRCLNLVTKPGAHNLPKLSLKCVENILKYTNLHNFQNLTELCQHSNNHIMLMTFFEKETCRPLDNTFLSFVQTWLHFTSQNKEFVRNKLSVVLNFWKITMFNLANMIIYGSFEQTEENDKLVIDILKLLLQFPELLTSSILINLQKIEENLK